MIGKILRNIMKTVALNVLYAKKENINPAYFSKNNLYREKKNAVIFIFWMAFILLQQKKKLESHKNVWERKDFCNVIMP